MTPTLQMPDLTPAQLVGGVGAIAGELVTDTLISNHLEKEITGLASIVIPLVWMIADAIIRHGRSKVAAVIAGLPQPPEGAAPVNQPAV